MAGPLSGLRVVELAAIGPVPFCGMLLANMGAEILLIEPPARREAQMPVEASKDPLFRGRSRLRLDLKSDADRARLLDILADADVFLEGFRPGVVERLGLGPEVCLKANPKLIYGRMTGWGQTGPLSQTAGHDPNYIAIVGVLHSIGYPDRPPTTPLNLVGDFAGGSLFLALGVLAALANVRAGGAGQVVDASIVDGTASLMTMVYSMRGQGMWSDTRGTNIMDGSCPYGSAYETKDGRYVQTCCLEPPFYRAMLEGLGLSEADLPNRFDQANWPALKVRFAEVFKTRTRDEWAALFEHTDACVTPILDLGEAMKHPQNVARGVFEDGLPAPAPRFGGTPTHHAPMAGRSAEELIAEWQGGKHGR